MKQSNRAVISLLADEIQTRKLLKELFNTQLFAALATLQEVRPYNNLIAFAATEDLKCILFVTKRATTKYANLLASKNVSVLIDNRSNRDLDFRDAVAVTATGSAEEVREKDRESMLKLYLSKHHSLEKFASSPESALFLVRVKTYLIVRNFQDVVEWQAGG